MQRDPRSSTAGAQRTDIQVLRAFAVGSVVLFHLWPNEVVSGWAGVDVFFVISGFLITSLIRREIEKSGRLSLTQFWLRRIRRIFPASFVVIVATAIAVFALDSGELIAAIGRHVLASAFSGENILLATDQTDYFHHTDAPSPLQHFWSLAVEEQFYLVWPLVITLVVIGFRSASRIVSALRVVVLAAVVASLTFAIVLVSTGDLTAYFQSLARAWELGLGAALALWTSPALRSRWPFLTTAVNRVAWVLMVVSFFVPDLKAGVPGWGSAPSVVLATIIIGTGSRHGREPRYRWTNGLTAIGVWVGDRSFSLYLWHWPLIILAPYALGRALDIPDRLGILAIALVLSELSFRFVENPVRNSRWSLVSKPVWTAIVAATLSASLAWGTGALAQSFVRAIDTTNFTSSMSGGQSSPKATLHGITVTGVTPYCEGAGAAVFTCDIKPDILKDPTNLVFADPVEAFGCPRPSLSSDKVCYLGDQNSSTNVLFIGDSHARQLAAGLNIVGTQMGWKIEAQMHSSCAFAEVPIARCAEINQSVLSEILAHKFKLVITAQATHLMASDAATMGIADPVQIFVPLWKRVVDAGIPMVTFADNPNLTPNLVDCERINLHKLTLCDLTPRIAWNYPDYAVQAAHSLGIHVVDLRPLYCEHGHCPLAIGGVRVYQDDDHITYQFGASLAPLIWSDLLSLGVIR